MTRARRVIRRALLPAAVFAAVAAVHFTWRGLVPDRDPAQDRWVAIAVGDSASWLSRYVEAQDYWLGFSYAMPLAFAVAAFRRYREDRLCPDRTLAIGGVTLSGVLSVAGCFLVGCCGSPMLGVYVSLFGAAFLPFAKPLVALVTALSLGAAWWWMNRRRRRVALAGTVCPPDAACPCR